jgi:transposase
MQPSATVFSQLTCALFPAEFSRCAEQFPTTRPTRGLTSYDHFLALCFGQLTYRESLRDVVACLKARGAGLYHLGFRGHLSRTNLAYAGRHRDWRLFQALAQILMRRAARLYQDHPIDPELPRVAFALDSSIISLSLNLFPWGYYARSRQSALKLHLMLSLQGNLPAWGAITQARFPDMKILNLIPVLRDAYYVMDRGYLDFIRLYRLHQAGGFFVVRNKRHVKFRVLASRPVDKTHGLRCDQTIQLVSPWSRKSYPIALRRIRVHDAENQVTLVLLTNQFDLPAAVIAELYRKRWQVELFFKWIKQQLRIKAFYGTSENAVRTQIWIAVSVYVLVAIIKKRLDIPLSLYTILQILSLTMFERMPLYQLLSDVDHTLHNHEPDKQLNLFN